MSVMGKDPSSIVIYGRSLGSGPSCYLAERLSRRRGRCGCASVAIPDLFGVPREYLTFALPFQVIHSVI